MMNEEGGDTLTKPTNGRTYDLTELHDFSEIVYLHTLPCTVCGKDSLVIVPLLAFRDWQGDGPRRHIQNAMYFYTAEHRELIGIGIHPICYEKLFAGGEDEE